MKQPNSTPTWLPLTVIVWAVVFMVFCVGKYTQRLETIARHPDWTEKQIKVDIQRQDEEWWTKFFILTYRPFADD